MKRLILASGSPRRAELLRNAGIEFRAVPADLAEDQLPGEAPLDYCRRVACDKACAVAAQFPAEPVLGADTIVVLDGDILGKPRDTAEARATLRRLSGRTHEVMTGVCLIANGREQVEAEITRVQMIEISDQEIADYAASGEPMDKAGAYAIQGAASRWIPRIEGCYFNVVGLPVPRLYAMLKRAGVI
jgi:septum formation protein